MAITAIIMAGGRGTRIKLPVEKPLLEVAGKSLIARVIDAVKNAKEISDFVVAVTDSTPKTMQTLVKMGIKTIKTPGKDYVSDTRHAIKACGAFYPVLIISADLPLITANLIDKIVKYHKKHHGPALTVTVPIELCKKLGVTPTHAFEYKGRELVPAGINIINGRYIDETELKEKVLVLNRQEIAVNVNSINELKLAEKFLKEKPHAQSHRCDLQ